MEDDGVAANGDTVDDNLVDRNAFDGVYSGGNATLNDLCQMGRVLHRFDIFESFFKDFVGEIDWGGEDYDGDDGLAEEDMTNLVEE